MTITPHPIQTLGAMLQDSARPARAVPDDIPAYVLGRIDTELTRLPEAERAPFLSRQFVRWLANQERFYDLAECNECLTEFRGMVAFDFRLIIDGICVRRDRARRAA